ncbi:MAG: penicillin-binding transpeptidase domain-containing protein [Bacillota bacterium]
MRTTPGITTRKRILVLLLSFTLMFVGLVGRLAYIQFIWGAELQAQALELRMRDVPVEARRGVIYDRRGRELAVSLNVESVFVYPAQIVNPEQTARVLAGILQLNVDDVLRRITRVSSFEWVKRKIEDDQARQLKELNLPGVGFTQESKRFYPKGNLASHVIGIAGIDSQGLEGIELFYDRVLRGTQGRITQELDARSRELPQALYRYIPPVDGKSLILTIDETIQYIVERELEKLFASTQARAVMAIFMDPRTGEILALANRPDYDPNHYQDYPAENRRNTVVADAFPPGSTFKPITAAGALELGLTHINERFHCGGSITVSGWTISCHRTHGSLNFLEIIKHSCNVGFATLGLRMGAQHFHDYLVAFGLTGKTGIDLPGEATGLTVPRDRIKPVDLAVMSFGQTLIITPLQLLNATAAIANGGMLMTPHLVKEIRSHDGSEVEVIHPTPVRRVISETTAAELRRGLEMVVDGGTGRNAFIEGYRIAGKTGTAQKVIGGAVVHGRYIASFVGFAPADNPQVVGLVMVDDPVGAYYGGQVAAPVFGAMIRDILRYLEVPPSLPPPAARTPVQMATVPDVTHLVLEEALAVMERAGLAALGMGEGTVVVSQFPVAGVQVPRGTTVVCYVDQGGKAPSGEVTVPRLAGKTIKEAGEIVSRLGLKLQAEGSGVAREQVPAPGTLLRPGGTVHVTFAPPQ